MEIHSQVSHSRDMETQSHETNVSEENIKRLVDQFYYKVRKDEMLSPVFNEAIGEHWDAHLIKMYDFWSNLTLKTQRYQGNPAIKHKSLPPFKIELFERWLNLFAETADEIYTHDIASNFKAKSKNIAESLKYLLYSSPFNS